MTKYNDEEMAKYAKHSINYVKKIKSQVSGGTQIF